jgi:hypothetical protein
MQAIGYRAFVNRELPLKERACGSKALYISRAEAKATVRHGRRMGSGLHPYRCEWCSGWHLGHPKRAH